MTNNPYQAPLSNVDNASIDSTYQPKLFSTQGRIGRFRYLAYSMASILVMIPMTLVAGIAGLNFSAGGIEGLGPISWIIMGLLYLVIFVWTFVLAKRRFNDINITGWISVTLLIPLISFIAILALLFWPGTKTTNRFGPRPTANSLPVTILGWLVILLVVGSIVAAVALPVILGTAGA